MSFEEPISRLLDIQQAPRPLVGLSTNETISATLETLSQQDIQCVVLVDEQGVKGLVSVYDIMTWICFGCFDLSSPPTELEPNRSLESPIGDICQIFHEETNKVWKFNANSPIKSLIDPFCLGVHRGLVEMPNEMFRLVTQTDLIKFIYANRNSFDILQKTVEQLGFAGRSSSIVSMKESESALVGFRRMEMEKVFALPILDESGSIVGNLSASDVRGLNTKEISKVLLPVNEFLAVMNITQQPVTCTAATSLGQVLETLIGKHIHRIWVVEGSQPINVITLSSILYLFR